MSKGASKLSRCLKAPIRALCRARDLYVRSMTGCAGRMQQGLSTAYPSTIVGVPRSFSFRSANSSDDDMRELIRAVSQRRASELAQERMSSSAILGPRSQSVAFGRIDEEEPCEFEEDARGGTNLMFPRSRSCAVVARTKMGRVGHVLG